MHEFWRRRYSIITFRRISQFLFAERLCLSCEAWPRSRRNGEDVVLAGDTLCGFVLCTMEVEGVVCGARNETTIEKGVCSFRVVR